MLHVQTLPSVLWHWCLDVRKTHVKNDRSGAGMVICLERGAISCYIKIQIGLTFWCRLPAYTGWPGKEAITSGYAMWFTTGGAIRIAHYDVIDDVITQKL